jgi:probable metal-binding protein
MISVHGHAVLEMMDGNDYTESSLLDAIHKKFGTEARFHTCSQSDMNANQLVAFLKAKGKFKPTSADNSQFTVDTRKICRH